MSFCSGGGTHNNSHFGGLKFSGSFYSLKLMRGEYLNEASDVDITTSDRHTRTEMEQG